MIYVHMYIYSSPLGPRIRQTPIEKIKHFISITWLNVREKCKFYFFTVHWTFRIQGHFSSISRMSNFRTNNCLTESSHRWDDIRFWINCCGILADCASIAWTNFFSIWTAGCIWRMRLSSSSQRCFIRFKSGDLDGHGFFSVGTQLLFDLYSV